MRMVKELALAAGGQAVEEGQCAHRLGRLAARHRLIITTHEGGHSAALSLQR
jgi:hypothetical protein